jgi:hypothetical protein
MAQGSGGGCRSQASAEHDAIKGKAEGGLCAHHLSDGRMVARLEAIPRSDAYTTHGESMNKEQTKKAIEVMEAYVDGKKIECRTNKEDSWGECATGPLWSWLHTEYRVKHEVIKYKRALMYSSITDRYFVFSMLEGDEINQWSLVRWIDEEWQDVEV